MIKYLLTLGQFSAPFCTWSDEACTSQRSFASQCFFTMCKLSGAPVHMVWPLSVSGHTLTDCLPQNTEFTSTFHFAGQFRVVFSESQIVTCVSEKGRRYKDNQHLVFSTICKMHYSISVLRYERRTKHFMYSNMRKDPKGVSYC